MAMIRDLVDLPADFFAPVLADPAPVAPVAGPAFTVRESSPAPARRHTCSERCAGCGQRVAHRVPPMPRPDLSVARRPAEPLTSIELYGPPQEDARKVRGSDPSRQVTRLRQYGRRRVYSRDVLDVAPVHPAAPLKRTPTPAVRWDVDPVRGIERSAAIVQHASTVRRRQVAVTAILPGDLIDSRVLFPDAAIRVVTVKVSRRGWVTVEAADGFEYKFLRKRVTVIR